MGKLNRRIPDKKYCECIDHCGTEIPLHHHFVSGHQNKSNIGTHHSLESNEQCRQTNLETWSDPDLKQRHSILMKEVRIEVLKEDPTKYTGFTGHTHTKESNEQNSQSHLGKPSPLKGTGKPLSPSQPCACGCLGMTKPGNIYIHGHASFGKRKETHPKLSNAGRKKGCVPHNKGTAKPIELHPCACGCPAMVKGKFKRGHGARVNHWSKSPEAEAIKKGLSICASERVGELSPMFGKRHKKESKVLQSLAKIGVFDGANNPAYIDGRCSGENNSYPIRFDRRLKEFIRDRDNRQCQMCSKSEKDNRKKLPVHHIDYDKKNLFPENLVALCHSCHSKTNYNRPYWISFFKDQQNNANADFWLSQVNPAITGSGYIPDPYRETQTYQEIQRQPMQ